jgi:hypothetical protein
MTRDQFLPTNLSRFALRQRALQCGIMAAAQRQERKNEMQVDKNHNETATACVAEFFSKMTQGQIDPGALTTALFNKAIIEMMRMDGADAVHNALRVYADQFDDRKPNDGTNDNGSRLAEQFAHRRPSS